MLLKTYSLNPACGGTKLLLAYSYNLSAFLTQ
jgi:hypothetical protein